MKSQFPELCLINQTWMDSVMCSCVWSCSLSKLTRISCFQQQGASFTCRQGWEMEYGAPMKQIMRTFPVNCWLSFCYMCVMSVGDLSSTHHVLWVSVDFSIQVLSSGSWPFQQSCTFALPTEVKLHLSWSRDLLTADHLAPVQYPLCAQPCKPSGLEGAFLSTRSLKGTLS